MSANNYIILIPLLPLLGFMLNGGIAFQRARGMGFVGTKTISIIACLMPLLAFALGVKAFLTLAAFGAPDAIKVPAILDWIVTAQFSVAFGFTIDHLSALMVLVVTGVGFLIHLYSVGYMKEDPGFPRYMAYLNLFLFFMLLLVMGDSLLLLFVGWEGVGLCSYLLIGFWFTDAAKAQAGKKAFIVNRIGDFGFMIGMFMIVTAFSSALASPTEIATNFLSFETLAANKEMLAPSITLITLCLFFGATGKSAQIPLYVWLPDAMAGPTPVSALIHAATMVTAGIYMIARLSFLFAMAPLTLNVIAGVGLATAFFAALIGVTQYDIKKVLAYSTVSQLGFMFLALGMGGFSAAMFHVITHAFFKACLFLGAGSVIHGLHHEQDIRFMGGLFKKMPKTSITFLICVLAISGIPPFSGFFSKDEILYLTYAYAPCKSFYIVALLTAGITAFYMMRLFVYTFVGQCRNAHPEKIHESPWTMTLPLILLAILATVGGFMGIPHFSWLEGWLEFLGQKTPHHVEGFLQETHLMIISTVWAAACSLTAYFLYRKNLNFADGLKKRFRRTYYLVANKFKIDELYNAVIITPIKAISEHVLFGFFDRKVIDGFLVEGAGFFAQFTGRCMSFLQSGVIGHYILFLILGLMAMLIYLVK